MGDTRIRIKATATERSIIKPILATLGTKPETRKILLGPGPPTHEMLSIGKDHWLFTEDYAMSAVWTNERGMHAGVRWPELLMVYFTDPKWTERQFKKFGHCVAY